MMKTEQVSKTTNKHSIGRREDERQLIAEQMFMFRRRFNFTEIGRRLGVSSTAVKQVARGYLKNERIMSTLLDEWLRLKSETAEYEFWRDGRAA